MRLTASIPGTTLHPAGPLFYRVAAVRRGHARIISAAVLAGCLGLLGVARTLNPSPAGHGTHQQLGLPPCSFVMMFAYPCPTCGMTTAFAHTVRGNLPAALSAHPGGLLLSLATAAGVGLSLSVLVSGRVWAVNWIRVSPTWLVAGAAGFILGGWAYKVALIALGLTPAPA